MAFRYVGEALVLAMSGGEALVVAVLVVGEQRRFGGLVSVSVVVLVVEGVVLHNNGWCKSTTTYPTVDTQHGGIT